jgi:lipopolysaccharide export LptBFGC system permease protein LptF
MTDAARPVPQITSNNLRDETRVNPRWLPRDVLDLRVDMHDELALPLSCLVMALVGLPFAFIRADRGSDRAGR